MAPYTTFNVTAVLILTLMLSVQGGECIECYSCANVSALASCNTVTNCPDGSICSIDLLITNGQKNYTLGCKDVSMCLGVMVPTHPPAPVGRSTMDRRDLAPCSDCCNVSNCNRQLCQTQDSSCTNQASYDCSAVGSSINICADTDHAKLKCRHFCGLCSLKDGGWSDWSPWSACTASCAGGTQTRIRSCSNPPPQDGGEDCSGPSLDTQACAAGPCPVQGIWGTWHAWGACSSTCDIGLQKRLRMCTFPPTVETSGGERPCDGEPSDSRLCFSDGCVDGGWGGWGAWSACSHTCGDGLRSRSRACDNPPRSVLGRDCPGDSSHSELCTITPCQEINVVFLARTVGAIPSLHTVIFKTVEQNVGNGYNNVTGRFTAPVSGTYSFSAQLCPKTSTVVFQLMKDDDVIGGFYHGMGSGGCASLVSDVMMSAGEAVWVRSYYTGGDVFEDENSIWNMFTGVLIRKINS